MTDQKDDDLAYRIVSQILSNESAFQMDTWMDISEDASLPVAEGVPTECGIVACLAGHIVLDEIRQRGNRVAWLRASSRLGYPVLRAVEVDSANRIVESSVDDDIPERALKIWKAAYGYDSARHLESRFYELGLGLSARDIFADERAPSELHRAYQRWRREHGEVSDEGES